MHYNKECSFFHYFLKNLRTNWAQLVTGLLSHALDTPSGNTVNHRVYHGGRLQYFFFWKLIKSVQHVLLARAVTATNLTKYLHKMLKGAHNPFKSDAIHSVTCKIRMPPILKATLQ